MTLLQPKLYVNCKTSVPNWWDHRVAGGWGWGGTSGEAPTKQHLVWFASLFSNDNSLRLDI